MAYNPNHPWAGHRRQINIDAARDRARYEANKEKNDAWTLAAAEALRAAREDTDARYPAAKPYAERTPAETARLDEIREAAYLYLEERRDHHLALAREALERKYPGWNRP